MCLSRVEYGAGYVVRILIPLFAGFIGGVVGVISQIRLARIAEIDGRSNRATVSVCTVVSPNSRCESCVVRDSADAR